MYLIETNQPSVTVEDLGITIRLGSSVWITGEQFRSSVCLKRLKALGQVRVTPKKPSRVEKKPTKKRAPLSVSMSRPRKGGLAKPLRRGGAEPSTGIPVEQVRRMVNQAALEAAEAVAGRILGETPTVPPVTGLEGLEALEGRIEQAVGRALSGRGTSPVSVQGAEPTLEEPMFIPEGIVNETDPSVLETHTEASSDEGLEDAAAALRALRRNRKEQG